MPPGDNAEKEIGSPDGVNAVAKVLLGNASAHRCVELAVSRSGERSMRPVRLASGALAFALSAAPTTRARAPPPIGTLVDIGGQRIHLHCMGLGSPTVVLESGTGDISVIWALVEPLVVRVTRVCDYDRGGYAWSDRGTIPRTFAQLALELHTALTRSGEHAPLVLVGQSYGGLVVRGYAARYPRNVAGMVLVDAVHEDQHIVYGGQPHVIRAAARGRVAPPPHISRDTSTLQPVSNQAADQEPLPAPLDLLPDSLQRIWRWAAAQPTLRAAQSAEVDWSPEELARMHAARATNRATLADLPLIVLARNSSDYPTGMSITPDSLERERRTLERDLAHLSHRGSIRFVDSGHNIHLEHPEIVAQAIRDVVTQARRGVATTTRKPSRPFRRLRNPSR